MAKSLLIWMDDVGDENLARALMEGEEFAEGSDGQWMFDVDWYYVNGPVKFAVPEDKLLVIKVNTYDADADGSAVFQFNKTTEGVKMIATGGCDKGSLWDQTIGYPEPTNKDELAQMIRDWIGTSKEHS